MAEEKGITTAKEKRPKSNLAQIISALAAIIGFIGVGIQVNFIRSNAKESAARQVYMSYSEAALRYPEFVEPDLQQIKAIPKEYVRYKSFVARMLFAYDEIFAVYDHPEWHKSFQQDVKYQMQYICNDMTPDNDATYFEKMRNILKETRTKCEVSPDRASSSSKPSSKKGAD